MSVSKYTVLEMLRDDPVFYRVDFAKITGGVIAGLLLSQMLKLTPRNPEKKGWFYKTQQEWTDELGVTRRETDSARRALRKLGILCEKRKGVPAKIHYKLNTDQLFKLLQNFYSNALNSQKNTSKITPKNPNSKYTEKKPKTETKTRKPVPDKGSSRLAETYKLDCTKRANKSVQNVQPTCIDTNIDKTCCCNAREESSNSELHTKLQMINHTFGEIKIPSKYLIDLSVDDVRNRIQIARKYADRVSVSNLPGLIIDTLTKPYATQGYESNTSQHKLKKTTVKINEKQEKMLRELGYIFSS